MICYSNDVHITRKRDMMKCILLCAGYATRLFPLTENFPKALLEIGGRPLLDYILDEVNKIDEIDEVYVITNNRYASHFEDWANRKNNVKPIKVFNDHTMTNDDRLGAIGDIRYTIDKADINDDVLIVAGDNLFEFSLEDMVKMFHEKNAPVVGGQVENDRELLKRLGVLEADENGLVIGMEEKPAEPKGNIKSAAIYLYTKDTIGLFDQYLEEGNNPDAPGYFLNYLYKKTPVYVKCFDGEWFDVGTHETLAEVNRIFNERNAK